MDFFVEYVSFFKKKQVILDNSQTAILQELANISSAITKPKYKFTNLFNSKADKKLQGYYIYGPVGRGKSMIMDAFYQTLPIEKKLKIHFHQFMQNIHNELFEIRKNISKNSPSDPITKIAKKLAKSIKILCLDELQITDITDAMIVGKLFEELLKSGIIIIITSNRAPDELYENGLQREHFLKFIAFIKEKIKIIKIESPKDYRLTKLKAIKRRYFYPLGNEADKFIKDTFDSLADNASTYEKILEVKKRKIALKCTYKNILLTSFDELCMADFAAIDYIEICKNFKIIILINIPKLKPENRNEAKRLVSLIDEIYENKIMLICSSEVPIEEIYTKGDGAFEFERTVSRLIEMQSDDYYTL